MKMMELFEVPADFLDGYQRRQVVTKCWRRDGDAWAIRDEPFIDDWGPEERQAVVESLRHASHLFAAFGEDGMLMGFASLGRRLGSRNQYMELKEMHTDARYRGRGLGKKLFHAAAKAARKEGAEKLYISAHSSAESQGFYRGLGCVDTVEPDSAAVEAEPWDCQLEYDLTKEA